MSWNGYPSYVRNSFIKCLKSKNNKNNNELDERKIIWIRLPYLVERGHQMKRNCFKKVKRYLKEEGIFKTLYTGGCQCFVPLRINSNRPKSSNEKYIGVMDCNGCNEKYIGKTDHNIITHLHEHRKPYQPTTAYSPYQL